MDENGGLLFPKALAPNNILKIHAAISPSGVICVVGCSTPDKLLVWLSSKGWLGDLGFGMRVPVIRWNTSEDQFEIAAPLQAPYEFRRIRVGEQGGVITYPSEAFDGSSQGFLSWTLDRLITYDQGHNTGITPYFVDGQVSGSAMVGLGPKGLEGIVGGKRFTIYTSGNPREPQIAGDLNRFACGAWLDNGNNVLAICEPPFENDVVVGEAIPLPEVLAPIKPVWIGAYKDKGLTLGGNCTFVEGPGTITRLRDGAIIATMVDGSDSTKWTTPAGNVWDGVYTYIDAPGPDTIMDAQNAMRALIVNRVAEVPQGRGIVLICQMYDRNLTWKNEATLAGIMLPYAQVANSFPEVKAMLFFSGPDRRGGTGDHPALATWYKAIVAAVQGEGEIEEPVVVVPPVPEPPVPPVPEPTPTPPVPVVTPPPVVTVPPVTPRPRGGLFWSIIRGIGSIFGFEVR
jgi:hypothetical protein